MKEGRIKGVKTWECKSSNNGQKGQRLTVINNTRTTSNKDSKYPEVLENRDPLSLCQLITRHFFQHMPPNCMPGGRIFRRAATTKQRKVSICVCVCVCVCVCMCVCVMAFIYIYIYIYIYFDCISQLPIYFVYLFYRYGYGMTQTVHGRRI
jgi:hypothetical protein